MIKILLILCLTASSLCADFGGIQFSKERASSKNGVYQVVITPFQGFPKAPGSCVAQMFRNEGGKHVLIWSRPLINNYRPCELLVTNSGGLVTLDDSQGLGIYPVVLYSSTGELKYIARLSDFPELENNKAIPRTESGLRRREKSTYYLSEVGSCLVIAAPGKDTVFVSLSGGLRISKFMSSRYRIDWDELQAEAKKRVEEDGARRPATAADSDSERKEKPNPESEERPQ